MNKATVSYKIKASMLLYDS